MKDFSKAYYFQDRKEKGCVKFISVSYTKSEKSVLPAQIDTKILTPIYGVCCLEAKGFKWLGFSVCAGKVLTNTADNPFVMFEEYMAKMEQNTKDIIE